MLLFILFILYTIQKNKGSLSSFYKKGKFQIAVTLSYIIRSRLIKKALQSLKFLVSEPFSRFQFFFFVTKLYKLYYEKATSVD